MLLLLQGLPVKLRFEPYRYIMRSTEKIMGRPKANVDADQVEKLAQLQCTLEEIAEFVGCSHSTISRRFAQEIAKGRASGRISLRRAQWKLALGGNVVACIWLGKQHLGQSDKVEQKIDATVEENRKALNMAEVAAFLDAKKVAGLEGGTKTVEKNVGRN